MTQSQGNEQIVNDSFFLPTNTGKRKDKESIIARRGILTQVRNENVVSEKGSVLTNITYSNKLDFT